MSVLEVSYGGGKRGERKWRKEKLSFFFVREKIILGLYGSFGLI